MTLTDSPPRSRFVGVIEDRHVRALVEDERIPIRSGAPSAGMPVVATLASGTTVLARRDGDAAEVLTAIAEPGTALAELHRLAAGSGIDLAFPDAVMREVEAWRASPGIDDPVLVDRTAIPFVTIDNAQSLDLDQALFVEARAAGGWTVHYAIADASYYVPRGSALWVEALRRGASYYLPGLSLPMLPRQLSEGLVSLNPDGPRRAIIFEMELDAHGACVATRLVRARIHSRAKLSFSEVQQLHDEPAASALTGSEMETSLRLLAEVGRARLREAEERDVVRYRRREVDVSLDGAKGAKFVVLEGVRVEVELWNEQISLLCNAEGARLLRESNAPWVQPIYRVHPAPDPSRVEGLRTTIAGIAGAHGLDHERWVWDGEHASLAQYVADLPIDGEHARVARAIQRQAILVNVRSTYSTEAAEHHGAGFEPYARFSAPMREIVGVYLHAEAAQMLAGGGSEHEAELRRQVVDAANRSKDVQRRMNDLVNRRVIDRLFAPDLDVPRARRRTWIGTVMGVSASKLHVQLDTPGIDVKVYVRDLGKTWRVFLVPDELGVLLRERETGRVRARAGDAIGIRVVSRDAQWDRWVLEPVELGEAERAQTEAR